MILKNVKLALMEVQEQCSPLTKRKHRSVIKKLH